MNKSISAPIPYRDLVRGYCRLFQASNESGEWYDEFHEFLQFHYSRAKTENDGLVLFILGAGLLTYGHIEVVEVILDNIPASPVRVRRFTRAVETFLPVPKELGVISDTVAVKQWFLESRDNLYWDEQQFIFRWKQASEH